jgi:hypothetical protein
MWVEPESFSALSASARCRTLRAYSNRVYWKPPHVPTKGQSCLRANLIPFNIP